MTGEAQTGRALTNRQVRSLGRALPKRLLDGGFEFATPTWDEAALELVARRAEGRKVAA